MQLRRGIPIIGLDDRREFFLGRFCAARARLHHSFIHWEYSLFRSLEQEVARLSSDKDGDAVMERLVKKGVIEQEFMTSIHFDHHLFYFLTKVCSKAFDSSSPKFGR